MNRQRNTTPTHNMRALPLVMGWLLLLLFASPALAGGVVEELRGTGPGLQPLSSQSNDFGKDVKEAPTQAHPHVCTDKQKETGLQRATLFYDPVRNVTILRWKARSYNGSKADEYHIYRWSFDQPTRQLIAKVDGATFEYIDRERLDNIMYSYNIVAIYRVNGKETSFAYPTLNQKTPTEPTPAPAEFGCSATRHNAPGSPWLWLLVLPLFGLIRRKERTL